MLIKSVQIYKKYFTYAIYICFLLISNTKFTTAVLLIIKIIFLEQLVSPFLQTLFPPVLCPEQRGCISRNRFLCSKSRTVYLLQTLPA